MRLFLLRLAAFACVIALPAKQARACKCGSSIHKKNKWENAKLEASNATAIFEGTLQRLELKWAVLDAKEGELIPADISTETGKTRAHMVATFQVQRAYKGNLGPEVQLATGLGGGDCAARFTTGQTYLVYAYGPTLGELGVSMCSPGGWIGSDSLAADLRYLRNERPIANDLVPLRPQTPERYAKQEEQRQRRFQELQKRYAAVTGTICGRVVRENTNDGYGGTLSFLSTAGYSPFDHPMTGVSEDGSFCSERLGPGKYYLYFTTPWDKEFGSASYYPGVDERTKAATIEVSAGQTRSDVVFRAPVRKTYAVRGFISANDKSTLRGYDVTVLLIRLGDSSRIEWYQRTIDFQGSLPLPKVKYFNFEHVVPGRYIAYASVMGRGWFTRKVEVDVSTHMKFISLRLTHKK